MPPEKFRATSNSIPRKMGLPLSARAGCTAKNLLRFHIPPEFHLPHPLTSTRSILSSRGSLKTHELGVF
jgi:hypothetical protein